MYASLGPKPGLLSLLPWIFLVWLWQVIPVVAGQTDTPNTNGPSKLYQDFSQVLGLNSSAPKFLDPDQAFVLTVEDNGASTLIARWQIAEGYYLYRDKFSFSADPQVGLGAAELPPGEVKEDEIFGSVETYTGPQELAIVIPVADTSVREFQLNVGYQGCAEDGICYPPIKKQLPVRLATSNDSTEVSGDNGPRLSEQDAIAKSLAGGAMLPVLLSFFGFGLLLSFTPCVFPMVPILSGIIVGQGQTLTTRRAFVLSSIYVVSMALTYAGAGVVAGLFGQNLQAAFQAPWVLSLFSAVFVLLALSMFGLFEIQLPGSWQTRLTNASDRQTRGTLHGVAVMGVLSAIIVGPCVAPPLAGALIYIGQTGNALLGGAALFSMALGMGSPLLAIGTSAGRLLPKVGPWMKMVKQGFGVIMLGLAISILSRILPEALTLLLWGILLIGVAVFMGAMEPLQAPAAGWRRLGKGLGFAMLIYGSVLIVAAGGGGTDVFRPLQSMQIAFGDGSNPADADTFRAIKGVKGLEDQLILARASGRPAMLDLYADWCIECKRLDKETFSDPQVRQILAEAVLLKADVTANDELDRELLQQLELYGPPAVLFYGADGDERRAYRLAGFVGPEAFYEHLQRALVL